MHSGGDLGADCRRRKGEQSPLAGGAATQSVGKKKASRNYSHLGREM
jgi:hypothetical protein